MKLKCSNKKLEINYSIILIGIFGFIFNRLAFGLVAGALVWVTPHLIGNGEVPAYYFIGLIMVYFLHQVNIFNLIFLALFLTFSYDESMKFSIKNINSIELNFFLTGKYRVI